MAARGWRESLQLDELYAVLREVKTGALSEDEAITRLERSPAWVWTAMAPDSKLLLVIDVGTRTLAMAHCRRQVSGSVWRHGAGSAGTFGVWPQEQYSVCRKVEPGDQPARGGGGATSQHALSGRGRLTPAAGNLPRL
jgi:hypothetical protein